MPLSAILGLCLLLPSSEAPTALSVADMRLIDSTQSQETQPNNVPPQSSSSRADQPKNPDQSGSTPQQPTSAPPCPENSQPGSGAQSSCKSTKATGTKTKKPHSAHKATAPATTSPSTGPTKTVVRNGGTTEPDVDLSPEVNSRQASQIESTTHLLADSDANLKKISGRQLTPSQQDTVKQIKTYMEDARGAAKDGDALRAYNLAVKANLLSAELAGQ